MEELNIKKVRVNKSIKKYTDEDYKYFTDDTDGKRCHCECGSTILNERNSKNPHLKSDLHQSYSQLEIGEKHYYYVNNCGGASKKYSDTYGFIDEKMTVKNKIIYVYLIKIPVA